MFRTMMKSKIHRARVTDANLKYMGSITIDSKLLKAADIEEKEKVQIVNLNNGTRIETYVMAGRPGSGAICFNGAAARWAEIDDIVIIISYALVSDEELKSGKWKTRIVFVDEKNRIKKIKREEK